MAGTVLAGRIERKDEDGTARAFGDPNVNVDFDTGGFTSGLLVVQTTGRTGDTTMDVTTFQGANVGPSSAFAGAAYTPPDGALAQFGVDAVQTSRVALRGQTFRVTLAFAGASGGLTSRVSMVFKAGDEEA